MQLVQKLIKRHVALPAFMFISISLLAFNCGGNAKKEIQQEPAAIQEPIKSLNKVVLNLKDNQVSSSHTTSELMIQATALTTIENLKLVAQLLSNTSNESHAILTFNQVEYPVQLGKAFEIDLAQFLGLGSENVLKEGAQKTITIKFCPLDPVKDLTLMVQLQNNKKEVISNKKIVWGADSNQADENLPEQTFQGGKSEGETTQQQAIDQQAEAQEDKFLKELKKRQQGTHSQAASKKLFAEAQKSQAELKKNQRNSKKEKNETKQGEETAKVPKVELTKSREEKNPGIGQKGQNVGGKRIVPQKGAVSTSQKQKGQQAEVIKLQQIKAAEERILQKYNENLGKLIEERDEEVISITQQGESDVLQASLDQEQKKSDLIQKIEIKKNKIIQQAKDNSRELSLEELNKLKQLEKEQQEGLNIIEQEHDARIEEIAAFVTEECEIIQQEAVLQAKNIEIAKEQEIEQVKNKILKQANG